MKIGKELLERKEFAKKDPKNATKSTKREETPEKQANHRNIREIWVFQVKSLVRMFEWIVAAWQANEAIARNHEAAAENTQSRY